MTKTLIEIISVGFPFCAFKIITGLHFSFWPLIILGVVDLIFNTLNLIKTLLTKKPFEDACLLSFVASFHGRFYLKKEKSDLVNWRDLGNSFDVLLSFTLVAFIIGFGHIVNLEATQLNIWNICVVFNVFGAGYSRVAYAVHRLA